MLLRSVGKVVAVIVAAGLAGAIIGVVLAELTGDEDTSTPAVSAPATATTTRTSATPTSTTRTQTTASAPSSGPVPRVRVLSARLVRRSPMTERMRLIARVRVTNRSRRPLALRAPVLLSGQDELPLDSAARDAARPLLRRLAPGASATGDLRFTTSTAVTRRLMAERRARLRIASRTVVLRLTT